MDVHRWVYVEPSNRKEFSDTKNPLIYKGTLEEECSEQKIRVELIKAPQLIPVLHLLTSFWCSTCSFSDVYACCGLNSGSNLDVYSILHIIQTSDASVAIQGQIPHFLLPGLLGNGSSSRNEKLSPKIFSRPDFGFRFTWHGLKHLLGSS